MDTNKNKMLLTKVREGVSAVEYLIQLIEEGHLKKVLEKEWLPEFYKYNQFFDYIENEHEIPASEIHTIKDIQNEIDDTLTYTGAYWIIEKISKLKDYERNGIPETDDLKYLFGVKSIDDIDKMIKKYEKDLESICTAIVKELRKLINQMYTISNIYAIQEDIMNF